MQTIPALRLISSRPPFHLLHIYSHCQICGWPPVSADEALVPPRDGESMTPMSRHNHCITSLPLPLPLPFVSLPPSASYYVLIFNHISSPPSALAKALAPHPVTGKVQCQSNLHSHLLLPSPPPLYIPLHIIIVNYIGYHLSEPVEVIPPE